jgi:hypothetical protein
VTPGGLQRCLHCRAGDIVRRTAIPTIPIPGSAAGNEYAATERIILPSSSVDRSEREQGSAALTSTV